MVIKKIMVENFRNIKYAELDFCSSVNILYGNNAQGKTNMLEAISIALGKSFRNISRNDILPFGNKQCKTKINLFYESEIIPDKINEIQFECDSEKSEVKINSIPLKKAADLYGEFKYVIFIPDNLNLIKGYPETRRFYLDNIAVMQNKAHRKFQNEYKEALKQRCAAHFSKQYRRIPEMTSVWDDILIKQGINLTYGRLKYLSLIRDYVVKIYRELSGGEELGVHYVSNVFGNISEINSNNKDNLYGVYKRSLNEVTCEGHSAKTPGAHRDDVLFTIGYNNEKKKKNEHSLEHSLGIKKSMSARSYGSQGQLRSIAVSLKLAEAEIIRSFNRENPVILLDEVLGELDRLRRQFVAEQFVNSQVFITSCNKNDFESISNINDNIRIWRVDNGAFELFRA